jgi:hypothetical protein
MMIWLPIENVWDPEICARTLQQFYTILEMHHGFDGAWDIWMNPGPRRNYDWDAVSDGIDRTYPIHRYQDHEGARLALEYHSMPKPRKKTLARVLAQANKHLPKEHRYGTNGTTSALALEKQIDRALKGTKGLGIEKLRPNELKTALNDHTRACWLEKAARLRNSPYAHASRRLDSAQKAYNKATHR